MKRLFFILFFWIFIYSVSGASYIYNDQLNVGTETSTASKTIQFGNVSTKGCLRFNYSGTEMEFSDDCSSWNDLLDTTETNSLIDSKITTHAALTDTHGVSGAVVGTTSSQVLTNKTFDTELIIKELTTPSNPSSGYNKLYFKTDSKLYLLQSDGTETEVGSNAGGGDADTVLLYNMEFQELTDFDLSGNNSEFDGGGSITSAATMSTASADIVGGVQALHYDPDGDGSDDYFGITIDIPQGYRGRFLKAAFEFKNDSGGTTNDGDFEFCVKQKDGANAGHIECLSMDAFTPTDDNANKWNDIYYVWSDCTQIEAGWHNKDTTTTIEITIDNFLISKDTHIEGKQTIYESAQYNTYAGYGSTNNKIPYFTNEVSDTTGNLISIAHSDTTNGFKITALRDNVKVIGCYSCDANIASNIGWSLNSNQLTTNIGSITTAHRLAYEIIGGGGESANACFTGVFNKNDVFRPHTNGDAATTVAVWSITVTAQAENDTYITSAKAGSQIIRYDGYAGNEGSGEYRVKYKTEQYNKIADGTDADVYFEGSNSGSYTKVTALKSCYFDISINHYDTATNSGLRANIGRYNSSDVLQEKIINYSRTTVATGTGESASITYRMDKGDYVAGTNDGQAPDDSATHSVFIVKATPLQAEFTASIPLTKTCYAKDVKAANTAGGTFTQDFWQTRDITVLNSNGGTSNDGCSFAVLDSDSIELGAGTYRLLGHAPADRVNAHRARWFDTDNSIEFGLGSIGKTEHTGYHVTTESFLSISFTILGPTTFELQHYCDTTELTTGFGSLGNLDSDVEIYSELTIIKEK